MIREVIGEGGYGCVHKPSIHCKSDIDPNFNYSNYVSKIMKTKDAEKELKEFVVIGSYDKTNEYHLGTPVLCQPELNDKIIKNDISKCKYIEGKSVKASPNDYKLLLLQYGGPNLKDFCMSDIVNYLSTKKKHKSHQFWLEIHRLLKGLHFFRSNNIVHNDIKPQNILFNVKTGKLAFIDFGLMRSKTDVYNSSSLNKNFLGTFHWSYPFDCGLMNKDKYETYNKYTPFTKNTYKEQLSNMIIANSKVNTLKLPIKHPDAFNIIFSYIDPDGKEPVIATKYAYIQHFFDGFNNLIKKHTYDEVLTRIINSIDVYGLGFSLQYILNCFYRHRAISLDFFTRLSTFFHKMYDFNPETREIDTFSLLNEYENILLETGILTRLKKTFVNNNLIDTMPVSTIIMKKITAEKNSPKSVLSKDLDKFANLDPQLNNRNSLCPEYKDFNPITKRCVKRCKWGKTRNERFKCVSLNPRIRKTRKRNKRE